MTRDTRTAIPTMILNLGATVPETVAKITRKFSTRPPCSSSRGYAYSAILSGRRTYQHKYKTRKTRAVNGWGTVRRYEKNDERLRDKGCQCLRRRVSVPLRRYPETDGRLTAGTGNTQSDLSCEAMGSNAPEIIQGVAHQTIGFTKKYVGSQYCTTR